MIESVRKLQRRKISHFDIDHDTIRDFACYAFLRGELALKEVNKPNIITNILNSLGCKTEIVQEDLLMHPESIRDIFDSFDATIAIPL